MSKIMTVGPKGQVVIPAEMRAKLGIQPGDQVVLDLADAFITLTARRERLRRLRGKYAHIPESMAEELHRERREQAEAKGW